MLDKAPIIATLQAHPTWSYATVAAHHGIAQVTVRRIASAAGITLHTYRADIRGKAVAMLRDDAKVSYSEIARTLGCSQPYVAQVAKAEGLTRHATHGQGAAAYRSPVNRQFTSTPLPRQAKKALTTPDTLYLRISGVMSSDFSYSHESHTLPVDDGLYECVPTGVDNPEQFTYWSLSQGESYSLTNPYVIIPTENVETLHEYTALCYDHLTEEAHRAIHGDI